MGSALTTYLTIVTASGVLNFLLLVYVLTNRRLYGAISTFFLLGVAATTIYCFAYSMSLTSSTLDQMRFWSVMQYFGMPFAPAFGLMFVLRYLGYRLPRWQVAAMLVIPVMALAGNATNDWHHLHYKTYSVHDLLGPPYYRIEVGPTYVIMGAYLLVCLLGSIFLLLSRWRDTAWPYRGQLLSLTGAHLIPMVASFLYLIGVTPEGIDPVPMLTGVSAILLWWTIESSRLLTVVPVAKEVIFHSISDGVIVLDNLGRLVEYNEGCRRMFPRLDESKYGHPLDAVWSLMFGTAESVPVLGEGPRELEVDAGGPDVRHYRVRISPLTADRKRSTAGTVMIISDITELKLLQQKLEHHAYYDELTQVFNRRAFFERCESDFARAKREALPFTTILFDIDNFKQVNDTYGHSVGDQVLAHVARIANSCLQEGMLFARYGGEEFVLALAGRSATDGKTFAEQLRRRIAAQPLTAGGKTISITSSFGVAETTGVVDESLQHLLHFSDKALYEAKRSGRNRVCVYGQSASGGA